MVTQLTISLATHCLRPVTFSVDNFYFAMQSIVMKILRRSLAALEITLLLPAVLFMTALFLRSIQPTQLQPSHAAQQIVDWYAARPHLGLWILLIALPITVLASGVIWLSHQWTTTPDLRQAMRTLFAILRAHASVLLVAAASLTSVGILAIVAMHLMTD